MNQLNELLKDHQPFHSEFQMDHFITIRAGGTPWGMYRQALRELDSRKSALLEHYSKRQSLEMQKNTLDRTIADQEREFKHFYAQAVALKNDLGELTPERKAQLERETWLHRLKMKAAIELRTIGRVSEDTMETLLALPKVEREAVLEVAQSTWLENQDLQLPKPKELPQGDVKGLLNAGS